MEVRTGADALKAFLGVSSLASPQSPQVRNTDAADAPSALAGDQATLSQAGTEVSQVAVQGGVREEKVAAIQRALAAGSYNVPASAVADKVMDAMLSGGIIGRD